MNTPAPKKRRAVLIIAVIAVLIELLGFNLPAIRSMGSTPLSCDYEVSEGLKRQENGTYLVTDSDNAVIYLRDIEDEIDFLHIGIEHVDLSKRTVLLEVTLSLRDEGHELFYEAKKVATFAQTDSINYFHINTYGKAHELMMTLQTGEGAILHINDITIHARVPLRFKPLRVIIVFAVIFAAWYAVKAWDCSFEPVNLRRKKQALIVAALIILNVIFLFGQVLVNNGAYDANRPWLPYTQYQLLTESLLQGKVTLNFASREWLLGALPTLENPYDYAYRLQELGFGAGDFAYFGGEFYCYFGIVPVLFFFLPFYALTGAHMQAWMAIFICCSFLVMGAFFLVRQIVKRWYPKTSFPLYIALSLLLGNGTGGLWLIWRPYFFSLPIITALMLTVWGLGYWVAASVHIRDGLKHSALLMTLGSLCMALTAGSRPQFLVASFLCFPILWSSFVHRPVKRGVKHAIAFALPYLIIAAGLMYYNYIRFRSPFDFGANYNLTSNDMTRRGFRFDRIIDGVYAYLLQLPTITTSFPYFSGIRPRLTYIGETITENMFGGMLTTHIILWSNFTLGKARRSMQKALTVICAMCLVSAVIVVIADTQMAGILARYYTDFAYLLFLPAALLLLHWSDHIQSAAMKRKLLLLILLLTALDLAASVMIGISFGQVQSYSGNRFYMMLEALF